MTALAVFAAFPPRRGGNADAAPAVTPATTNNASAAPAKNMAPAASMITNAERSPDLDIPIEAVRPVLNVDTAEHDANNITERCSFSGVSDPLAFENAIDGKLSTVWTSGTGNQSVTFTVPKEYSNLQGIYIRWAQNLTPWELDVVDNGEIVDVENDLNPIYYAEWVPIPQKYRADSSSC